MPDRSILVGNLVTLAGRGDTKFVVIDFNDETLFVRQWPIAFAPPVFEVPRKEATLSTESIQEVHE